MIMHIVAEVSAVCGHEKPHTLINWRESRDSVSFTSTYTYLLWVVFIQSEIFIDIRCLCERTCEVGNIKENC
jgi:hypothetical protein